ncbi:MAG: serine/threonine protein kinase [Rhodospirillaceae bacterium]|nr:serine/threonine protein kinase [Rhodospirillaceae bacterium]
MTSSNDQEGQTRLSSNPFARPRRLGRYRLERELGRGAMGSVYLAVDETMDRQVALKTIHPALLGSEDRQDWLDRFLREARAAARCLHPNIVTVFDFGDHDGVPFISMEYVDGQPVRTLLTQRGNLTVDQAVTVVGQVLAALAEAHTHGVVHRDIKPANVLLTRTGTVKVTDFGIARLDTANWSGVGTMVGTPSYMSPEQFSGDPVDARTDIFAVGVLLYELLTGGKPFPGKKLNDIMTTILEKDPRDPAELGVAVPPGLMRVVSTALNKAPADRYSTAEAFRNALMSWSAPQQATTVRERLVVPPGPAGAPAAPVRPAAEIPPAVLEDATKVLSSLIGPLARVLVDKQSALAADIGDLYARLAESIADESDRRAFLRRGERVAARAAGLPDPGRSTLSGTGTASGTTGSAPATWLDPGVQKRLTDALLPAVGPMAGHLVRRESRNATGVPDLVQRLAQHIPEGDDRKTFFRTLGIKG